MSTPWRWWLGDIFRLVLAASAGVLQPAIAQPAPTVTPAPPASAAEQLAFVTSADSDTITVIDVRDGTVRDTLRIGSGLRAQQQLVVAPDDRFIYVSGRYGVYIFAVPSVAPVGTIPFDGYIGALLLSPDGTRLYVVGGQAGTVSVLSTATGVLLATVAVPGISHAALSPDGSTLYVVAGGQIELIDTATYAISDTISFDVYVASYLSGIALAPDGSTAYVAAQNCPDGPSGYGSTASTPAPTPTRSVRPCERGILVIDIASKSLSRTILLPVIPVELAVAPNGSAVYATAYAYYPANGSGAVAVVDPVTGSVRMIYGEHGVNQIVFTPDGTRVYLAGERISVLDTATFMGVELPLVGPAGVAVTRDGRLAYVSAGVSLSVLDAHTDAVLDTATANSPSDVVVRPHGDAAYVAANTLLQIDTATRQVTADVPVTASSLAASRDGRYVYASAGDGITSVDLSSLALVSIPTQFALGNLTVSPDGAFAYGTTGWYYGAGIGVVNLNAQTPVTVLPTGGGADVAVAPDRSLLYDLGADIAVVGAAAGEVIRRIALPLGTQASHFVITSDGALAYVAVNGADANTGQILVIRTADGGLLNTISIGRRVDSLALSSDGSTLIASDAGAPRTINGVSLIDIATQAEKAYVPIGEGILHVAIARLPEQSIPPTPTATASPTATPRLTTGREVAYIADCGGSASYLPGTVTVIDIATRQVVTSIPVDMGPRDIVITPDGRRAYLTSINTGTVSVIDTASNTVAKTIKVGATPWGIAVTADGARAYVANADSDTVSVIDTSADQVTATVRVGYWPNGVAANGPFAYVVNRSRTLTNSQHNAMTVLTVLAGDQRVIDIPVSDDAQTVALSPDGSVGYVPGSFLSLVDARENVGIGIAGAGKNGLGVAVSPDGSLIYVTNERQAWSLPGTVVAVDAATTAVKTTIPVGVRPFGVAFTDDSAFAYVTNEFSDTVSIIDTASSTVVQEINAGDGPEGIAIARIPAAIATPSPTDHPLTLPTFTRTPTPCMYTPTPTHGVIVIPSQQPNDPRASPSPSPTAMAMPGATPSAVAVSVSPTPTFDPENGGSGCSLGGKEQHDSDALLRVAPMMALFVLLRHLGRRSRQRHTH
jgi:YVTN family beta-propeller protein